MAQLLHIVVTCSNRKSSQPEERLLVRSLDGSKSLVDRCKDWQQRLVNAGENLVTAEDLYQGPYWSQARSLTEAARASGFDPKLWVCSAGYGLIQASDNVASYGATFSLGEEDSVGRSKQENQAWWNALAKKGPAASSLSALLQQDDDACVLIAISSAYLHAVERDLIEGLESQNAAPCFLLTGVEPKSPVLQKITTRIDARMLSEVGGSFMEIFPRTAKKLLKDIEPEMASEEGLRAAVARLSATQSRQPAFEKEEGDKEEDQAIRSYIKKVLRKEANMSKTRLLKRRRKAGLACEQKRFYRLFEQVKEESHGKA